MTNSNSLVVALGDETTRLDTYISDEITDLSRSRAKTSIEKGLVTVNGAVIIKPSYPIKINDLIVVQIEEPMVLNVVAQDIPIEIIYQDSDLAVINKPKGMVTHPAMGSCDGTLVNALLYHIKDLSTINGVIRPGIVHRLDKNTSGLIVIAKNDAAHISLSSQIAQKTARRTYIGLVDGNIKEDSGSIVINIDRNPKNRKLMAATKYGGRYARTNFTIMERFGAYTLVKYELFTGRTHQIRVHSKYIHHPIVGDEAYGGSNKFGLDGQLLHAFRLTFNHPTTGENMAFECPLPPYFVAVLEKLKTTKK